MKKIIAVLLILVVFGIVGGCGDPEEGIPQPKAPVPTQQLDENSGDQ